MLPTKSIFMIQPNSYFFKKLLKIGEGVNLRFYLYQIQDLEIKEILTHYTLSQGLSCKYTLMSLTTCVYHSGSNDFYPVHMG